MMYITLLNKITDFLSVLSFNSHIGKAKSSLLKGKIAQIKEIQNMLSTIFFIYIEKYVSAPSPQPKIKRKRENDMVFIDKGNDKNFFLTTEKSQLCISCSLD